MLYINFKILGHSRGDNVACYTYIGPWHSGDADDVPSYCTDLGVTAVDILDSSFDNCAYHSNDADPQKVVPYVDAVIANYRKYSSCCHAWNYSNAVHKKKKN